MVDLSEVQEIEGAFEVGFLNTRAQGHKSKRAKGAIGNWQEVKLQYFMTFFYTNICVILPGKLLSHCL